MKVFLLKGLPQPRMFPLNIRVKREFGDNAFAYWNGTYQGVVVSEKQIAEYLQEEEKGVIDFIIEEVDDI